MSGCYINVRIGLYHFQLSRQFKPSINKNTRHIGYPHGFFQIYEFWPLK